MGMQSAGKSSTLERVVGAQVFPLGSKTKTTMPILLELRYDEQGNHNKVKLSYTPPECDDCTGRGRERAAEAEPGRRQCCKDMFWPDVTVDKNLTIDQARLAGRGGLTGVDI